MLCEDDIRRFGRTTCENTYVVDSCFLCSERVDAKFRFKPKTKSLNVLTIDGGGVKGIIPLQGLQLLELMLEPLLPGFPIQDHFRVLVGTSSGEKRLFPHSLFGEMLMPSQEVSLRWLLVTRVYRSPKG